MNPIPLLAQAVETSADGGALRVLPGLLLLAAVAAAAAWACARAAKRPLANARCFHGLALVLGAAALALPVYIAIGGSGGLAAAMASAGVLALAGAVVAVLGLSEAAQVKTYVLGRGAGVAALALTAALFGIFGYAWQAASTGEAVRAAAPQPAEPAAESLAAAPALPPAPDPAPPVGAAEPKGQAEPDYGDKPVREVSKRYGYTVRYPERGAWKEWKNLAADLPEAETGLLAGNTAAFAVVPVWTREADVPPEAVSAALLGTFDVTYPNPAVHAEAPRRVGEAEVQELRFEREIDGEKWTYRFRLYRRGAFAWLVSGWWDPKVEGNAQRVAEVLDGFALSEDLPEPPALAEAKPGEQDRHRDFFNEVGLHFYDKRQYAKALGFFRASFECGRPDAAILGNAAEAFAQLKHAEEGLAYLEKYASKFPGDHGLAVRRAEFLMQLGRTAQALDAYAQAFGGGWVDDGAFAGLVRALNRAGRMEDAVRWLDIYSKRSNTSDVQLLRAETLRAQQKDDEAAAVLEKVVKAEPRNADAVFALIDLHADNERHREALELCTKAIEGGLASADLYYAKGDAECGLKWYRDAKGSFEEALRRSPNDEEIRAYLEYVNGLLGEGANTAIKTPIPEVPLPAELAKDADPAAHAAYLKGAGACYLLRATGVAFEPGERLRTTEYLKAKVLEARSLEAFSTFQFAFDPLGEAMYVNRLRVYDGGGKLVSEGRVEACYVLDHPDQEMATNDKLLTVPVPGLQTGYTVELVVTRREFAPSGRFPFARRTLAEDSPVLTMAYWIQGDLANVKTRALRLPEPLAREGLKLWRVEAPEVCRWEPLQDEDEAFLPMLFAGDARDDWAALGREHLDEMKEKLVLDENTRFMAADALKGIEGRPEKIRAAVKFIQDRLTYRAIEFGERARIPNDTARIMKDRYGDCKDHALLLHLILKDAGIPSHLALVSTDTPVAADFPSLNQFDHMIVCVPDGIDGAGKGPAFVDPTDHDVNPLDGAPLDLDGGQALVLDPAHPRLAAIPACRAADIDVRIRRDCRPDPAGGLRVAETVVFGGACAVDMRGYLRGHDAEGVKSALKADLEYARMDVELSGATVERLDDSAAPVQVALDYRVKDAVWAMEDQWVAVMPALWERLYASAEATPERRTPFRRRRALALESVTSIHPPEGYVLSAKDLGGAGERKPFAAWSLKAEPDGAGVKLEYRLRLAPGRFGKERYGEYKAALDAAAEKLNARMPWKKAAK